MSRTHASKGKHRRPVFDREGLRLQPEIARDKPNCLIVFRKRQRRVLAQLRPRNGKRRSPPLNSCRASVVHINQLFKLILADDFF